MPKVDLTKSPIVQSPYVYLQAAGSDGKDKTVEGIHLRWDFLKSLGENHLAKGNYTKFPAYNSALGFNRSNDFIKIYRTPFRKGFFINLEFDVAVPTVINTGTTRAWQYQIFVNSLTNVSTPVTLRFIDYTQYDAIRATQTVFNAKQLMNAYTGIVEIEPDKKLFFYTEFNVALGQAIKTKALGVGAAKLKDKPIAIGAAAGYLRVESVTIPDPSDFSQKQVSCRKKFTTTPSPHIVSCENIQYLRLDYSNASWSGIKIYCYEHYLAGMNGPSSADGSWESVGDFALTTDDLERNNRFMPDQVDGINGHWPKFNESNGATGEFTVNKQNYFDRWRRPGFTFNPNNPINNDPKGLQHFIHKYMELSKTDERALASIPSDTADDPTTQDISYVDMLRLISLDYHVARILGLGHIDTYGETKAAPYIYCLEYKTWAKLEAPYNTLVERTHLFMTPPVIRKDYRLPATPLLKPLTFGISVDNGTPTPTLLTDAQGYAPFGNRRFININRARFNFEKPFGPFYYEPTEFCLCDETQPVAYGLEYKEKGETTYRKPEISHDSQYVDAAGVPETLPILEGGTPRIYTHQEMEEGDHEYRAFAINWFSRISPLSNPENTVTNFPKKSNLLPPFNFAVQLIQDEDPAETPIPEKTLILTTPAEQTMLAGMPAGMDNTLVRTSFDWNHVHHQAHQYADYADIFYRKAEPLVVKGKIAGVNVLSGNRAQITTTSYDITSTFPKTTVIPAIPSSDAARFVGSFFSSGGENYVVESVTANGDNPSFIVKQIKQIDAAAGSANSGQYISSETFQSPALNALFFITENMGAVANWDLKHHKRVYLEKFYTNAQVVLRFSATRTQVFDIKKVLPASGGNTRIEVEKPIKTAFKAGLTLEYAVKHEIDAIVSNGFTISGNAIADFTAGKKFRVFANKANDGLYTVAASSLALGGKTAITTVEAIPDASNIAGLIEIVVSRNVVGINSSSNSFSISGNKVAEIDAAFIEYKPENDGTLTRFVVGGIHDTVVFEPLLTTPPKPKPDPDPGPTFVPEGTGFIQLLFQNVNLLPHPDPEVNWYKGTVRLKDIFDKVQAYPITYIGNLTTTPTTYLSIVVQDPGFISKHAPENQSGKDIYSIKMNDAQDANYHPGYKLYLKTDTGLNPTTGAPLSGADVNFHGKDILPDLTDPHEGNRQTYMAIRSYDAKNDLASFLSNPVVLLAQKYVLPETPHQPMGPLYATIPDYFGKSTYTFDTQMNTTDSRVPYSLVFYRSSEDRILDALYRKSTQAKIWEDLNNLSDPKAKYDPLLWQVLFEGDNVGSVFKTYVTTTGQFTWPLPDNDGGIGLKDIDEQKLESDRGGYIFPFDTQNMPSAVFLPFACDSSTGQPLFDLSAMYNVYGKQMHAKDILKKAITSVFLPLNEQPPIFNHFKTGTVTSSVKPKLRDASGNLLDPLTNDIYPMIRILNNSRRSGIYVRFTDYTLDGASKSLYFYRVLEMDDKFKFSEASLPLGPVLMVNAFPPDKPQIRKVLTQLQNLATNIPSAVLFEINRYNENEKISKIEIYRATDEIDALSIRTMKKVKSVVLEEPSPLPIIDDFEDYKSSGFPPYGETLHYRIIAIREIEDVKDVMLPLVDGKQETVIVDLPSLPSDVFKASIVDVVNPAAPQLSAEKGTTTATELKDVVLKWQSTCYNGTYRLQKLNASGNWVQLYSEKITDGPMQYPPLLNGVPDFTNSSKTKTLARVDEDDNAIYHRFRVQVENSSGLFNLSEFELTVG